MTLDTLFGTTGHVDAWQECARAVVIFCYGLLLVRVAGRRVFAPIRHGISTAAIDEAMHAAGIRDRREVEQLLLEPNGSLSVQKRK